MTRAIYLFAGIALAWAAAPASAAGITYLECATEGGTGGQPRIVKLATNEEQRTVSYQIPANGNSWVFPAVFSSDNVVFRTESSTDTLSRTDLTLIEEWLGGRAIHGKCKIAPTVARQF